jgi:hypothetical protein
MTGEGMTTTITTPIQADLERMAEDGADVVHTDQELLTELNNGFALQLAEHVRAYQPKILAELGREVL